MASDVRQRMARSALLLIAERGVGGVSIADVLEHSGTPRGSVYHHFPGGKDELVLAAMEFMATGARAPLAAMKGRNVAGIITGFVDLWRGVLVQSEFEAGCASAGVATSAETDELRTAARRVFEAWTADLAALFQDAGLEQQRATDLAWMLFASTEGALIFARSEKSMRAMDLVEKQLLALASA
ncbi:TetR/AcrR family transcriptional regulator [Paenarthrobacter sp. NPDC058040]|uniref:TetR/AcrR family transcriptional regulator n=1 Tax=unclassified Paenarthrobacter TaxID=2634190 RepID=UPI0036D81838